MDGITTTFTMDLNTGLPQALSDGEHEYLYGAGRIAQLNIDTLDTEYYLTDALGSVRQLTDQTGAVTFAQAYDPYGVVTTSAGPSASGYGFTGEYQQDGLVYLRARHYAPYLNRFLQRDTIVPNPRTPQAWNRYSYALNNPVNFTDPTGYSACHNPLSASCQTGLAYVHGFASALKDLVISGSVKPVEAFATLADLSKPHFKGDIWDLVWAMTIVLNNFDANRGMVSPQVFSSAGSRYYIGQDWLAYRNDPSKGNKQPWCDPLHPDDKSRCKPDEWIHSLRGDWSEKYWDKTANQAYHFWGLLAITFFDGGVMGDIANWQHDGNYLWQQQEDYDFSHSDPNIAPPPSGVSKPDYDLSLRAISLGDRLSRESYFQNHVFQGCEEQWKFVGYTDIGQWIRANLKE